MRYFYEKPESWTHKYGEIYRCNHVLYDACTLFRIKNKGLCVIQQRFNHREKVFWWGSIDPWLVDDIFENPNFLEYFSYHADVGDENMLYPTVTVRQIMHGLRMKPLPREPWETHF